LTNKNFIPFFDMCRIPDALLTAFLTFFLYKATSHLWKQEIYLFICTSVSGSRSQMFVEMQVQPSYIPSNNGCIQHHSSSSIFSFEYTLCTPFSDDPTHALIYTSASELNMIQDVKSTSGSKTIDTFDIYKGFRMYKTDYHKNSTTPHTW